MLRVYQRVLENELPDYDFHTNTYVLKSVTWTLRLHYNNLYILYLNNTKHLDYLTYFYKRKDLRYVTLKYRKEFETPAIHMFQQEYLHGGGDQYRFVIYQEGNI